MNFTISITRTVHFTDTLILKFDCQMSIINFTQDNMFLLGGSILALTGALIWWNIDKINAKMLLGFTPKVNKDVKKEKTELFSKINDLAKMKNLEKSVKLKVLEIGGGTGANFEFLEESIHWTTIDPNEHCLVYYNENIKKYENTHEFGGVIKVSDQFFLQFVIHSLIP